MEIPKHFKQLHLKSLNLYIEWLNFFNGNSLSRKIKDFTVKAVMNVKQFSATYYNHGTVPSETWHIHKALIVAIEFLNDKNT